MKVILLRDVAKLGKRSAIVEVPDGYALNKLIPQGMASPATPENLKRIHAKMNALAASDAADASSLRASLAFFARNPLVVAAEANAQNHLFKAVKQSDISEAAAKAGHPLPADVMVIETAIKSLGEHEVKISAGEVTGTITVSVVQAA